jgi:hypothetical protein
VYKYFDAPVANLIVISTLKWFTSASLMEHNEIKEKVLYPSEGGDRFPWYLREMTGLGEAYAWFTFPKSQYPQVDVPIEAADDMCRFISLGNDVVS